MFIKSSDIHQQTCRKGNRLLLLLHNIQPSLWQNASLFWKKWQLSVDARLNQRDHLASLVWTWPVAICMAYVRVQLCSLRKLMSTLLHNCIYSRYQIVCASMHSFVCAHAIGKSLKAKGVDNTSCPICHLCFLSYSTFHSSTHEHPHTPAAAWTDSIPLIFLKSSDKTVRCQL